MGKRIFNILFHLHTVSSIVISVALYVIFFGGSFSFFRDEIVNWERNHTDNHPNEMAFDIDQAIDSLKSSYDLYGREISIAKIYNEQRVSVHLSASSDTLVKDSTRQEAFFYLDTKTFDSHDYYSSYTLGEFLYRLHFFGQIPYPAGYLISGFVAFFFLFAIITGVLVHWDKIIQNFYLFRPWSTIKAMWTDAHTALGLIGFPFQFVYAVTGAFFMLQTLLIAPAVYTLYGGDTAKLYEELEFNHPTFPMAQKKLEGDLSVERFIKEAKNRWEGLNVLHVIIHNYGDKNMHITVEGRPAHQTNFTGLAEVSYKVATNDAAQVKDYINESSFLNTTKILLYQLHYGDYGRLGLRVISFILGILSCFVILSGVMIWLVARNKKTVSDKRKKFNQWVVWIYLAICQSMLPTTALAFLFVKIQPVSGHTDIYVFYFITWLVLSALLSAKKNNFIITKWCLLSGGIIGFFIPIANGLTTGNWFWKITQNGLIDIFIVDALWLCIALLSLYASIKMKKKPAGHSDHSDTNEKTIDEIGEVANRLG